MEFLHKYLICVSELIDGDTWVFLVIGFALALLSGFLIDSVRVIKGVFCGSLSLYVISEIILNFTCSYLVSFIFLIIGTVSIGIMLGSVGLYLFRCIIAK